MPLSESAAGSDGSEEQPRGPWAVRTGVGGRQRPPGGETWKHLSREHVAGSHWCGQPARPVAVCRGEETVPEDAARKMFSVLMATGLDLEASHLGLFFGGGAFI